MKSSNHNVEGVHHIAFAVRDVEKTMAHWSKAFNLEGKIMEFDDHKKGTIYLGDIMFAFIEYTEPNQRFTEFLDEHGEGLHHLALKIDDIEDFSDHLQGSGFSLLYDGPQDAGVGLCNFLSKEDVHADIEIVEPDERDEKLQKDVLGN
ncbi:MAG: VOC family protein [Candidatus Bipolaricaulota bacterium]